MNKDKCDTSEPILHCLSVNLSFKLSEMTINTIMCQSPSELIDICQTVITILITAHDNKFLKIENKWTYTFYWH